MLPLASLELREPARLGLVMNTLNQTSTWQYAVITVRNEPQRERLVIPYPNEKTLRDLIAAASIVTVGYSSPKEALQSLDNCLSTTTVPVQELKAGIADLWAALLKEVRAATRLLIGKFRFATPWRVVRNLCHHSFANTIRFVFSQNILSSTLRAFISF